MAKRVKKNDEPDDGQTAPVKPRPKAIKATAASPAPSSTFDPHSLADFARELGKQPVLEPIFRELLAGNSATIDGAWGSSSGLAVAALANHCPGVLMVALAHPRDLEPWRQELECFTGGTAKIFPALSCLPGEEERIDPATPARLRALGALAGVGERPKILLTSVHALLQPVASPQSLDARRRRIERGQTVEMEELLNWLVGAGYRNSDAVELPGDFARRGGLIDVWSPEAGSPARLEFFGDEVDSIRHFAADDQRSLGQVEWADLLRVQTDEVSKSTGKPLEKTKAHLVEHLPQHSWVVWVEPRDMREQAANLCDRSGKIAGLFGVDQMQQALASRPSVALSAMPATSVEETCHLAVESVERLSGNIQRVRDELDEVARHDKVLVACSSDGEMDRLREVLSAGKVAQANRLRIVRGTLRASFRVIPVENQLDGPEGWVLLGSQDLFHRELVGGVALAPEKTIAKRRVESRAIDSFLDLTPGDLVVHVAHGIARFLGMELLDRQAATTNTGSRGPTPTEAAEEAARAGRAEEHLVLEFREGVRVFVPVSRIHLVQKYVGASGEGVELSRFGSVAWQKKKDKAAEAVIDLAADMISLQATRAANPGRAWPQDSEWQREFEASFPFKETEDQLVGLREIKTDLERPRPMDRLICGDVGFGKTELALRAAFKVADAGGQVAVLVPTTVLAEQHYRTFSSRMAEYPFTVACLNRFRGQSEQRRIVQQLAEGSVDVVVGTHRLVSQDIRFKDLGLVVIDEEQRFGVEHKERLKLLREKVDVLTMTATPIPRTLHQALLGIRDISNLETPPPDRQPVETRVLRFDESLIRHAVLRELNREGQVFFVHTRVHDIHILADRLRRIVPEARFVVAHGQMHGDELEEAMVKFLERKADILVSTTIIESGLDIPSANTIFINEADHYGLAELHQLRGRVGRSKERAYAYMMLDPSRSSRASDGQAARRLKAIEEFTALGSGFKIALRDLEIRGAGNLLGTQQSGHIAAVGYELYCQLLDNAVRQMRNQPLAEPLEVHVDLGWPAYLPRDFIPGQKARIEVYRRLGRVRTLETLKDFRQEMRDRFGAIHPTVEWLFRLVEVRVRADCWKISALQFDRSQGESGPVDLVLVGRNPHLLAELGKKSPRFRRADENHLYCRLKPHELAEDALYDLIVALIPVRSETSPATANQPLESAGDPPPISV